MSIKRPLYAPLLTRRGFIARLAAVLSLTPFAFASPNHAETMTHTNAVLAAAPAKRQAQDASIRPFTYHAPQAELDELRRRILATRWPEKETVGDFSQGVPLATIRKLADYWANEYDWRRLEAKLDSLPQFVTEIDGLDIHFIHVRSKHKNALPIVISHGWPGSVVEQLKLIDPLVNPTAHGGKESDAFDVVIPSMPGYGFSGKPATTGWDPVRIARAWTVLMKRLGYQRFVAPGGDWGGLVVDEMGVQAAPELIGIATNFPRVVPVEVSRAMQGGGPAPAGLSAEEKEQFERLKVFFAKGVAYAQEMGLRPQTLYGIADSPVGLAAWMLDHDARSLELIARSFDGKTEGLTRDDVLDNITLFWLTNTAISSSRLYWENKLPFFEPAGVKVPVVVSAFPDELFHAPRSWVEKGYANLLHYSRHDKGGHFAAWEQPAAVVNDLRIGFRSLH